MKLKKTSSKDDKFQSFDVEHDGKILGEIRQYTDYIESRSPGCRYVNSRREVKRWSTRLKGKDVVWGITKKECVRLIEMAIYGCQKAYAMQRLRETRRKER